MRVSRALTRLILFGVCAALLGSATARANDATYELTYEAERECPSREDFQIMVRTQLAESHELSAGAAPRVAVQFAAAGAGFTGRFELAWDETTRVTRELRAATCSEVAPALAFVLALALGKRPSAQAQTGNDTPPPPVRATLRRPARTTPPARPTEHTRARPFPQLTRTPTWAFGAGSELGLRWGLGPIWTFVESASVEAFERSPRRGVRWNVRASLSRSETISRVDRVGTTDFGWLAGGLELCPLQLSPVERLSAWPCAGIHLGEIRAQGRPAANAGAQGRDARAVWLDSFGELRFELGILPPLLLRAEGQLFVPLTRYRFAFDSPDTLVYRIPPVSGALFLGLVVHFS